MGYDIHLDISQPKTRLLCENRIYKNMQMGMMEKQIFYQAQKIILSF